LLSIAGCYWIAGLGGGGKWIGGTLGNGRGFSGQVLATHQIPCAFCAAVGNFETVQHLERTKPGSSCKVLNYDTLKCGNCGNFMFAFWSAAEHGHGAAAMHGYHVLPWHRGTTAYPKHWPDDVGRYWVEARRSVEGKNWTAAALMARSAVQLVARSNGAKGNNLKQEINDLADKGLILPIMKDWSHEVRELANEARIRSQDQLAQTRRTRKMSLNS
jgi:Domain of unknown function (DUF4145)